MDPGLHPTRHGQQRNGVRVQQVHAGKFHDASLYTHRDSTLQGLSCLLLAKLVKTWDNNFSATNGSSFEPSHHLQARARKDHTMPRRRKGRKRAAAPPKPPLDRHTESTSGDESTAFERAVDAVLKGENRGYVAAELEDEAKKALGSAELVFSLVGEMIMDAEPGIDSEAEARKACQRIWKELVRGSSRAESDSEDSGSDVDGKAGGPGCSAAGVDDRDDPGEFSEAEMRAIEAAKAKEREIQKNGCAMCERVMPLTWHHLIPKTTHRRMARKFSAREMLSRGIWVCRPCHSHIHRTHDNVTLADSYNTLDALLEDSSIAKWIKYASKQRPTMAQAKNTKLRYKR